MDALQDHRELEEREHGVEVQIAQVAPALLGVAAHRFIARGEAGQGEHGGAGDARARRRRHRAALRPVHHLQADVGQRIAQRRHLPIQDGGDVAVAGEHAVVEAVVAVDQRVAGLDRQRGGQAPRQFVQLRQLALLRSRQLIDEAPHLPSEEAFGFAEVRKSDLGGVDGVESHQRVNQFLPDAAALLLAERRCDRCRIRGYHAVHERHDVERRIVDADVLAQRDGVRDGHVGGLKRRDHAKFAFHVMRRGEDVRQRRAAQHPGQAVGFEAVGEVRPAVADDLGRERAHGRDVLAEPRRQPLKIDAGYWLAHIISSRAWFP